LLNVESVTEVDQLLDGDVSERLCANQVSELTSCLADRVNRFVAKVVSDADSDLCHSSSPVIKVWIEL
jgi:hypothetical protein